MAPMGDLRASTPRAMRSILNSLRKRKLVQWSVAYLAGAWVLYELIDTLGEAWGIGNTVLQVIQVVLVAGFLVALVVGWYHGEQGRQQVSGAELVIISCLLVLSAIGLRMAVGGPSVRSAPVTIDPVVRFEVVLPMAGLGRGGTRQRFAWSPDGEGIAYVGPIEGDAVGVWHRRLGILDPTFIAGSEGGFSPSFSPEGDRLLFLREEAVYVSSLDGASPVKVGDVAAGSADWGPEGWFYLSTSTGLVRMSASSGEVEDLTRLEGTETRHTYPRVLPNGRGVLFIARSGGPGTDELKVFDLRSRESRALINALKAVFSSTGHIVFVTRDGSLRAAGFDPGGLQLTGEPVTLGSQVYVGQFWGTELDLSRAGDLLYVRDARPLVSGELVWVSRDGSEVPAEPGWIRQFRTVALSPDDERAAVSIAAYGAEHVWIKTLGGGPLIQLSDQGSLNWRPTWRPDGDQIAYVSDRTGFLTAWTADVGEPTSARRAVDDTEGIEEVLWSRDGSWMLFRQGGGFSGGTRDILALRLPERGGLDSIAATEGSEGAPTLSPDGEWLAYNSTPLGEGTRIVVRAFPNGQEVWNVSGPGAVEPVWSRSGDEIFYRTSDRKMVVAHVRRSPDFQLVSTDTLFDDSPYRRELNHRAYDVTADGSRILMIRVGEDRGRLVWVNGFAKELSTVPRD